MSLVSRLRDLVDIRSSSRPVAAVRVVVGLAALAKALATVGPLERLLDPAVLRLPYMGWLPVFDPFAVAGIWVLSALAFMVGWRTRWAGSALTLVMAYVLALDQQMFSNHLYLLVLLCFLLTLSDAGGFGSIDALRQGRREEIPAWPVLLMKFQLTMVYGFGAIAKLNDSYISGSAIMAGLRRDGFFPVPEMLREPRLMVALAAASILAEIILAGALWSPKWRRSAVILGIGLHAGMILLLDPVVEISIFAAVTLALYFLFWDNSDSAARTLEDPREAALTATSPA